MRAIVGAAMILWGAALPSEAAEPEAPHCALLITSAGTQTSNAKVSQFWAAIDATVSAGASEGLAARGLDVRPFEVKMNTKEEQLAAVVKRLDETRCTKVVQLSRKLEGNGQTTGFSYAVVIFHLERSQYTGGNTVTTVGDYKKQYEFPLTADVMRTLKPTDIGTGIAADIDGSGVLDEMKTPLVAKPAA